MPLALTDPRWNELDASYGGTADVVAWLTEAYGQGLSDARLGDLINEIQHQGDTTTAMYAVAPHLVQLANGLPAKRKLTLLIHAGMIYAESTSPRAVPCPPFLKEEFDSTAPQGVNALAPLLTQASDFDEFKWGVAALSGFLGHHNFGRLVSGIDFYKGRFHLACLDEPLPEEE
jgi:hypothetical protein